MNTSKKYTTELRHDLVEALFNAIQDLISEDYEDDDDRLMMCGLAEVRDRLYMKLAKYQSKYRITFSSVQAIALRMFFTIYLRGKVSQLNNRMHTLATEVHTHYS